MGIRLLTGDCRDVLKTLPDESVHCVVTSPPYWGLRDYGTAKWEGGDTGCDHKRSIVAVSADSPGVRKSTLNCGTEYALKTTAVAQEAGALYRDVCGKCGARRVDSQIGLEPTFDQFIAEMVSVFREVRRVLRRDGTLWLNLGDSYAASMTNDRRMYQPTRDTDRSGGVATQRDPQIPQRCTTGNGLKPKDLCGIPWRVAFALQADGWWLRQDIIWSKPNPMPESVTDRCTKAHEYIFLLSKSARYFYDAEAIREPHVDPERGSAPRTEAYGGGRGDGFEKEQFVTRWKHDESARSYNPNGRNKRSVWEVATAPFSEAHFATFPPELIEPAIKAGCPKDGTVLDPFGGAGTTGLVADRLQRNAILIELNPQYAAMAERRISGDAPLFAQVAAE